MEQGIGDKSVLDLLAPVRRDMPRPTVGFMGATHAGSQNFLETDIANGL
jgi:hypothetical protein